MDIQRENALPRDPSVSDEPVRNVSEYIGRVSEYIEKSQRKDAVIVYRGEPEIYEFPGRPNLFRHSFLKNNPFFEKNLFDTMRQHKLSSENRYLDNAIDAQHGEFPSRLLDVSYNCLTALYFAVTPYYHLKEDALDQKDGRVFVFFADEIFSPSAQNTNDNYDAIIRREPEWYQGKTLFQKNRKLIDHTKLNNRIIAQQGAFFLFPGDEAESLPPAAGYGIVIPGEHKAQIRRDLKTLFGIHTGSIYPEIINLVEELNHKSMKLNTEPFSLTNELHYSLRQLKTELDYYANYLYRLHENEYKNMELPFRHVEQVIVSYRDGIWECRPQNLQNASGPLPSDAPAMNLDTFYSITRQYNLLVQNFSETVNIFYPGDFSVDSLLFPEK